MRRSRPASGRAPTGALLPSVVPPDHEADALSRTYRLAVMPCPVCQGCYRWIVSSSDGFFSERSAYPYATEAAAWIVGQIRIADLRVEQF